MSILRLYVPKNMPSYNYAIYRNIGMTLDKLGYVGYKAFRLLGSGTVVNIPRSTSLFKMREFRVYITTTSNLEHLYKYRLRIIEDNTLWDIFGEEDEPFADSVRGHRIGYDSDIPSIMSPSMLNPHDLF